MPFKTGTVLLSPEGRIAFASARFCDLVGSQPDRVAGMSWFEFVFPEDLLAARELFDTNKLPHAEPVCFRLRCVDGTEVWTNIQAAHLQRPGGETYGVTATVTESDGRASYVDIQKDSERVQRFVVAFEKLYGRKPRREDAFGEFTAQVALDMRMSVGGARYYLRWATEHDEGKQS
jgi:PAS domain S-box-containing protein